jgi:hypothetical protein
MVTGLLIGLLGILSGTGCVSLFGSGSGEFLPASDPGERVLAVGRRMSIVEPEEVRGSCYTFVDLVYGNAGFPREQRQVIFQGRSSGPWADVSLIRPGDWIMHINLEFRGIGHSSIFVEWLDREAKLALTLDHVGMNKSEPGKYRRHRLSRVFGILRPVDRLQE